MSNVEYRCPHVNEAGNRDCGMRHFGLPGGTNHKCRHHDVIYVQTEATGGPDFLYIDEDKRTKSKDILNPDKTRAAVEGQVVGEAHEVAPTGEQVILRGVYKDLTGDEPDMRWGTVRIREEIQDWKEQFTVEQSDSVASEPEVTGEPNEQGDIDDSDGTFPDATERQPEGWADPPPDTHGVIVDAIP